MLQEAIYGIHITRELCCWLLDTNTPPISQKCTRQLDSPLSMPQGDGRLLKRQQRRRRLELPRISSCKSSMSSTLLMCRSPAPAWVQPWLSPHWQHALSAYATPCAVTLTSWTRLSTLQSSSFPRPQYCQKLPRYPRPPPGRRGMVRALGQSGLGQFSHTNLVCFT